MTLRLTQEAGRRRQTLKVSSLVREDLCSPRVVVFGAQGELKHALLARLAARTRGSVLHLRQLITADMALGRADPSAELRCASLLS